MGVVYIGDRSTGKTHLAMELANPKSHYVKAISPDYDYLRGLFLTADSSIMRPTETIDDRSLEIQVQLPTGIKEIFVDWIDSPGEIWRNTWQLDNPDQWNRFLDMARQSEGILLIIPPYRELLKPGVELDEYSTQQQWCKRFKRWVEFFGEECPQLKHLIICLNKADLFCYELAKESSKLAYHPAGSQMNWRERHTYVFQRYFRPVHSQITELNRSNPGLSVRCFITSIHDRGLLELPWIYLGSFFAHR